MKAFTKVAKAAITGIVLTGILMTTACAGNQSAAPTSAPTVSQSPAAQSPAATPTPSASAPTIGPWGINIDDVVAKQDPSIAKVYPNETTADIKEGVLYALNTYQGLVNIKNFYKPRTASDDTLLFPDEAKFDQTFYKAMTARTTTHGGQFSDIVTFAPADGEITGGHKMDATKDVFFKSDPPTVYAGDTMGHGNVFVVKANATILAPTTDNKVVTIDLTYTISVTHGGQGKWLVSGLGWNTSDNPKVSDSVVVPKAPNGN